MHKLALAFLLCASAFASTFTYNVSVNTSSLTGTGTLYFQFNPGDVTSDLATATISNFSGAVLNGSPLFSGSSSGSLASSLAIANTSSNNDALQAVTFGSLLAFRVRIAETYTGTATTGSVFNFGIYKDDGFTPLLTTQPDGYSIIVNLDNANHAAAQSTTSSAVITNAVPEPGTLTGAGVALCGLKLTMRRKVSRSSFLHPDRNLFS